MDVKNNNKNVQRLFLGPPADACVGKANGLYGIPQDNVRFYSCIDQAQPPACFDCAPGSVFKMPCGICLRPDQGKDYKANITAF